ncbi:MAG TPA: PAS domain S-box protein, partial [Usitatibacteraceae bacterium]|nr:PAS domain S-box protein [Usitatibacteraceae bacterium]
MEGPLLRDALPRHGGHAGRGPAPQFNEEMCRLLGRTREEVAAVDWAEVTHPDDRAAEWELHQRIAAGEIDGYRVDKRFLRPDGSVVYVSEDLKAERDAEVRVSRFIAAHADITERVERLKAITRLRDLYDLLEKVIDRCRDAC